MNCQIIQINEDFLSLKVISSKIDSNIDLLSVIQIQQVDYLLESKNSKTQKKSFGEVIEQDQNGIMIRLFEPQKFFISKILQVTLVKTDNIFLPNILNSTITIGEKTSPNLETIFEFIPTVQLDENVVQGQKIGYINVSTNSKHNFKHWILAENLGKVGKIGLGDFQIGELIATIEKNNQILGSYKTERLAGAVLLRVKSQNKKLILTNVNIKNHDPLPHSLEFGVLNLLVDPKKQFLNILNFLPSQLENTVLIFVTNNENFTPLPNFNTITFLDKHNLGQFMANEINNLTLNICEIGYSVIVICQKLINLTYGQYKTINGEDVSITIITHDTQEELDLDRFDCIVKVD